MINLIYLYYTKIFVIGVSGHYVPGLQYIIEVYKLSAMGENDLGLSQVKSWLMIWLGEPFSPALAN